MAKKKYEINLSTEDRITLTQIIKSGISSARTIMRAQILLNSDNSKGRKPNPVRRLAEVLGTTPATIETVKKEFCEQGLEGVLTRKKRETPPIEPKVTGDVEAHVIAIACMEPPEGYSRWTLNLLADKTVELGYIDSISHMTVKRILKKTNFSLTDRNTGAFHQI